MSSTDNELLLVHSPNKSIFVHPLNEIVPLNILAQEELLRSEVEFKLKQRL